MQKCLVLFVHGIGGSAADTWQRFPAMVQQDAELAGKYEVGLFEYTTGLFGPSPAFAVVAESLKTEIETRYAAFGDVAIIAHSQGGLIARQYIADRINAGDRLPVRRLLTFATPHLGSLLATLGKWVPGASKQAKALAQDSDFIMGLAKAWEQSKADTRVRTRYVIAANDRIVGPMSAVAGSWAATHDAVTGVGHKEVVKPASDEATSFAIVKQFLLEELALLGASEADYRQPLLHYRYVEQSEATRFVFSSRTLPFLGRTAEVSRLIQFLGDDNASFRWMVMYGSGGVGKSRLALELCLAIRDEWHAGFLHEEAAEPDWARWQPLLPTLIVIDYAARQSDHVGRILRAVSGRGALDGTTSLGAPVRVLLIERTNSGEWLDRVIGTGTAGTRLRTVRDRNDLHLQALADPWPIFEHVFQHSGTPLPGRRTTLATLTRIDTERRPLFAHFVADAMVAGRDVHQFDRDQLLHDVVERWRDKFWRNAGIGPKEERTLALATMAGGLAVNQLKKMSEPLLIRWDVDQHPQAFLQITGQRATERISALAPDVVGEYFTVECLGNGNLTNRDRTRLCAHAWRVNPDEMSFFVVRAHFDLPGHPILPLLRKLPSENTAIQRAWALTNMHLIMGVLEGFGPLSPPDALDILKRMHALAEKRNKKWLWVYWGKAVSDFVMACKLARFPPDSFLPLVDALCKVAVECDNDFLWERWAATATNLVPEIFEREPAKVSELVDALRQLATQRGEAELWDIWAAAADSSVSLLASLDLVAAHKFVDEIKSVAQDRGEAVLWAHWAHAAKSLLCGLRSKEPSAAVALLEEIRKAAAQRNEAQLWISWGSAVTNEATELLPQEPQKARALLDEVRAAALERNQAGLWVNWAVTAGDFILQLAEQDPAWAHTLLDGIRDAAIARLDVDISILWAKRAVIVIKANYVRDIEMARHVYLQFVETVQSMPTAMTALFCANWAIALSTFVSAAAGANEISEASPIRIDPLIYAATPTVIEFAALTNIWAQAGQAEKFEREFKMWEERIPEVAAGVVTITEQAWLSEHSFLASLGRSQQPGKRREEAASHQAFRDALISSSGSRDIIARILDHYPRGVLSPLSHITSRE